MAAGFIHDMALMENLLMESKLCYTVVRPPGLNNGELNCYLEHGGVKCQTKKVSQTFKFACAPSGPIRLAFISGFSSIK